MYNTRCIEIFALDSWINLTQNYFLRKKVQKVGVYRKVRLSSPIVLSSLMWTVVHCDIILICYLCLPVPLLLLLPFAETKPPLLWPLPVETEPVTLLLFCWSTERLCVRSFSSRLHLARRLLNQTYVHIVLKLHLSVSSNWKCV